MRRRILAGAFAGLVTVALATAATPLDREVSPDEFSFAPGDLVLVWGRLRDCPDRLRLLQVFRLESDSHDILDLAEFRLSGRAGREVREDVRAAYRNIFPNRELPPVEIWRGSTGGFGDDSEQEARWLLRSRADIACERDAAR